MAKGKHVLQAASGLVLAAGLAGCAAMHEQAITNLRNNGEHARADCYARCDAADSPCMMSCDNAHPRTLTAEQQQMVVGAVMADAAKSKQQSQPAQTESSSSQSSSSSSEKRTLTINGTTYTGGPHLGAPCSLDSPCPTDYKCHLVTERSGQCVQ